MNKLTINCKKTEYCVFGMSSAVKKSKTANSILSLNNQILSRVCSYKYLGFTLDEHLNFNKHIEELKKLVTHKLYLMSKIRKYITTEGFITIFQTMVLSLIEYESIIYLGTSILNISKINNLFYRGLSICLNSKCLFWWSTSITLDNNNGVLRDFWPFFSLYTLPHTSVGLTGCISNAFCVRITQLGNCCK